MTVVQPRLAPPRISSEDLPDGSRVLRSEMPLEAYEPSLGVLLRRWANERPDHVFLAERDGDGEAAICASDHYGVLADVQVAPS